eukprot:2672149-Pyramimonas_sp.AAC.1
MSDGGPEFGEGFAQGLEQLGGRRRACDADSPRQNGRAERCGGWVEERARSEVESGASVVSSLVDLDELIWELVSHKNLFWHRG